MKVGLENLEFVLGSTHGLIKGADTKISIFLAFLGVFVPFVYFPFLQFILKYWLNLDQVTFVLFELGLLLLILTILKVIWGIIPSLNKSKFPRSLIFFGEVATKEFHAYKVAISGWTKTQYREDLENQHYINSKIARRKHNHFNDAVWLFLFSLVLNIACGLNLLLKIYG